MIILMESDQFTLQLTNFCLLFLATRSLTRLGAFSSRQTRFFPVWLPLQMHPRPLPYSILYRPASELSRQRHLAVPGSSSVSFELATSPARLCIYSKLCEHVPAPVTVLINVKFICLCVFLSPLVPKPGNAFCLSLFCLSVLLDS